MDRDRDGAIFVEALRGASLLAICFGAAVWILYHRLLAAQAIGGPDVDKCLLLFRCEVSWKQYSMVMGVWCLAV